MHNKVLPFQIQHSAPIVVSRFPVDYVKCVGVYVKIMQGFIMWWAEPTALPWS